MPARGMRTRDGHPQTGRGDRDGGAERGQRASGVRVHPRGGGRLTDEFCEDVTGRVPKCNIYRAVCVTVAHWFRVRPAPLACFHSMLNKLLPAMGAQPVHLLP